MSTAQRVENTERRAKCDGCGKHRMSTRFRGRRLCRECLLEGEIVPRVEDFVVGTCPLGNLDDMDCAPPKGITFGTKFAKQLDAAMKREGWDISPDNYRDMVIGAGADDGQHAQHKRWAAEEHEGEG